MFCPLPPLLHTMLIYLEIRAQLPGTVVGSVLANVLSSDPTLFQGEGEAKDPPPPGSIQILHFQLWGDLQRKQLKE